MPLPVNTRFADPNGEIDKHWKNLPHWQQDGATFFVTYRLADSLPDSLLRAWRSERTLWLALHLKPWSEDTEAEYHKRFSSEIDRWLDAGHGGCVLRAAEVAGIVAEVLRCFDGARYCFHAWVVMPNHVHLLFSLNAGRRLEDEIKLWKGVSARRINRLLSRSGMLWMPDYFDRLIRDERHFWNCARYIRRNPLKAGLLDSGFRLFEADAVRRHLDLAGA